MKNLKRVLLVVLACVLIVGLVACTAETPAADEPAAEAPAEEPAAEPAEAPAEEPAAEPAEEPAAEPATSDSGWPAFDGKILIGVSIRSISNPYHVQVMEGAELLAKQLKEAGYDVECQTLFCEGSDEQQISDIQSLIAQGGENTVLYVDPNNASLTTSIAEICDKAHVHWCSVWNLADGDYPMDYEYWVAHCSADDVSAGYDVAVELFNSFETPGKGKICALEGMAGNSASINRTKGLMKALEEYPDVELLDIQPTDWDMQVSLDITETWLSKYDDIDGVWTSGDPQGLGAITALQAKGLNGKVGTTGVNGTAEAVDAVKAGDMVCTWDTNGFRQGYYVTAYAVAALIGEFDYKNADISERMFLTPGYCINSTNCDSVGTFDESEFDFTDYTVFNIGPMETDYAG